MAIPAPSFTPTLMHPTLIAQPFHHKGWVYEEKVDGYRMVAHKDEGAVGIISRQGKDHTSRFPDLVKALAALSARSFILDGEVAVYGDDVKGDTDPVRTQVPGRWRITLAE
jgi:bifunctional non-homologous end joining protein LigD